MHPKPPELRPDLHGVPPLPASLTSHLDDQLDLGKYVAALRQRWVLVLVCCLVTVGYALIQHSLSTKEYEATAVIQIERKRLSVLAVGQAGWMEDWWNLEFYPTQYRLLRSRGMAERVVHHLRLDEDPEFTGRPAGAGVTADAEVARLAARVQGNLRVNPIQETQLVELTFRSTDPERAARIANSYAEVFIEWGIEDRTETVGQASTYLADQIETLRQEIEERQKKLNTYASGSDVPLDPAGEALIERQQTLEKQLHAVVGERIRKEAAYREVLNLSASTVASGGAEGRISELRSQLFKLESDYNSKLAIYTPDWPAMVTLKEEIDEKRGQLERLTRESYQEAKDRASAEVQKARSEEASLEQELQKLANDARAQNSTAFEYSSMMAQINTRKDLLKELVKRQSETEVQSQLQNNQGSNVRIVDRAIAPTHPVRPSLERNLAAAILVGSFAGVGIIFLLTFLDRTIKTPEELEGILGLPTLTVVPDLEEGRGAGGRFRYGKSGYGYGYGYGYGGGPAESGPVRARAAKKGDAALQTTRIELLPHTNPRLAVCEAYRGLRTALLLASAQELRLVALTSAEPGEGKTATTCNLGVVMAQLGRRVLIVDADLRRPRMHKIFGVSNRLGLVNYLTGKLDADQLFFPTEVENLWVCPSGPIPPNPSELLASDRMRDFLKIVRSRFDFVLLDTPPALPVADAVILGPHADGLVVCARAGVLLREDAKLCRERLRYAELRLLGTVLNRYSDAPSRYGRRYRYYGGYEEQDAAAQAHSAA